MTTKAKAASTELAASQRADLAPATTAEREAIAYFNDLNEQLETPFAQPRAIAERGTPFTVLRIGEREAENIDTGELERHLFLLVEFEAELVYKNNAREERSFAKGDRAIVSLRLNPIRSEISRNIAALLQAHGAIPHMTCREVPLTQKAKGKGHSPAITICHVSQWEAL